MRNASQYDKTLLLAVMALVLIGVIMVYSSSSVVALTNYNDAGYFMKRQILWTVIGLAIMTVAMHTDRRVLSNQRTVAGLVVITLTLLCLTFAPGVGCEINGARRWLRLGGLTFQPSELAKFVLVLYVSYLVAKKGEGIRDFGHGLLPVLVVTGIFAGLAALQPDFGSAVMITGVAAMLLFAGGASVFHLGGLALASLPMAYLAVAGTAYRLRRIFSFLDPWSDPTGAGHQIIQSFLAFGSGGILGRGLGEGRQKLLFLPERHSDFIYAVIGEELGLIGALAVVSLFGVILWRGVRVALRAGDEFSSLLALGITLLICVQGFVNMAVVTGLLPTKGIVLPFVSYGGSSLVITMAAAGVLLNISREERYR
jgi:cell division protein FtsW